MFQNKLVAWSQKNIFALNVIRVIHAEPLIAQELACVNQEQMEKLTNTIILHGYNQEVMTSN